MSKISYPGQWPATSGTPIERCQAIVSALDERASENIDFPACVGPMLERGCTAIEVLECLLQEDEESTIGDYIAALPPEARPPVADVAALAGRLSTDVTDETTYSALRDAYSLDDVAAIFLNIGIQANELATAEENYSSGTEYAVYLKALVAGGYSAGDVLTGMYDAINDFDDAEVVILAHEDAVSMSDAIDFLEESGTNLEELNSELAEEYDLEFRERVHFFHSYFERVSEKARATATPLSDA